MDLTKVLQELRRELDYLDSAILSLERLQARSARRRGRPNKLWSKLQRPPRSDFKRSADKIYRRHSEL
jgi:hypothetical protein